MSTTSPKPGHDRLKFSNRRTECPACKACHGFAALEGDSDAGKCHACGTFIAPHRERNSGRTERLTRASTRSRSPVTISKPMPLRSTRKKHVASYRYESANGILLYVVERYEWTATYADGISKPDKSFYQWRPGPNGERVTGLGNVRRVLYELPSVLSAIRQGHRIWIVEGEKNADALNDIFRHETGAGDRATTPPGGSNGWRSEFRDSLRGADVIVWPDDDEPGRKLGQQIIGDLRGIARNLSLVTREVIDGI